jgi:caa(3)-type oxidase subunit IV
MIMETKETGMQRGWMTFAVLVVLTAIEFAVSAAMEEPLIVLMLIAVIKAGLIIVYFMRFGDLSVIWNGEADE